MPTNFIFIETLLMILLILATILGFISPVRAGQVLIGIALYDIVLAVLSYLGWPVLRGDVSNQAPISQDDSYEGQAGINLTKFRRSSGRFILGLLAMSVVALGAGILLTLLFR